MPKRPFPAPFHLDINISNLCNLELDNYNLQYELVEAFVGHILYMREQIPVQFNTLLSSRDNENNDNDDGYNCNKREEKIIIEHQELMYDVQQICENIDIESLCLMLGATATSPAETYYLYFNQSIYYNSNDFNDSSNSTNSNNSNDTNDTIISNNNKNITRKLIRGMIQYWGDINISKNHRNSSFIAIKPRNSLNTITNVNIVCNSIVGREQFKVKCRNKRFRKLYVNINNIIENENEEEKEEENEIIIEEQSGFYFVSKKGIKKLVNN